MESKRWLYMFVAGILLSAAGCGGSKKEGMAENPQPRPQGMQSESGPEMPKPPACPSPDMFKRNR